MNGTTKIVVAAIASVALLGGLAAAHPRNYANAALVLSCIDKQYSGLGGAVGGAVNDVVDAADPLVPDTDGTCYRPGHIAPNANGDVTFTVSDAVTTNVGLCVTQDTFDDGLLGCGDPDNPDVWAYGCNSVTVMVSGSGWNLQDLWYVIPDRLPFGSATWRFLVGGAEPCGPGQDSYGTTGTVNHN